MHAHGTTALTILGLALLIDFIIGEYPGLLHPVVWLGKTISALLRLAPAAGWWRQFIFGAGLTLVIVGLNAGLTWFFLNCLSLHPFLEIALSVYLFKASFALRELGRAALKVVRHLEEDNLPAARLALRSLCSRDPEALTREELLAATIESLAENASDSFVARCFTS